MQPTAKNSEKDQEKEYGGAGSEARRTEDDGTAGSRCRCLGVAMLGGRVVRWQRQCADKRPTTEERGAGGRGGGAVFGLQGRNNCLLAEPDLMRGEIGAFPSDPFFLFVHVISGWVRIFFV